MTTALTLKPWQLTIGGGKALFCMLGINVLEDKGLALETATELKRMTDQLALPFVFKASFDKANRSAINSYRGPGMLQGLAQLEEIKQRLARPVMTDIHEPEQAERVAAVADIIQIPAFLCRQTDLVVAAARAVTQQQKLLQIKKGQFLAPWDCKNILNKINEASEGEAITILCERGVQFGYNNLVVDMLGLPVMKAMGVPVTIDATHAVQLPGADPRTEGASTGGRREGVSVIARSAIAAGADGVFLEFHPEPDNAKCDAPSCLPLSQAEKLLTQLKALYELINDKK